jgi:hypothetical protein
VFVLKVIGSHDPKQSLLEIDGYNPFRFYCRDNPHFVPFYWRTGDFEHSLMEIGINPDNGALAKIVVTFCDDYTKHQMSWNRPSEPITHGVPIFDLDPWPRTNDFKDNFRDESYPFKAIIGKDFASYWVQGETKIQSYYIYDKLCIGVDIENSVRKIEFMNLSEADIQNVIPRNQEP